MHNIYFEKSGLRFISPFEIFRFIENGGLTGNDSLYIDNPPTRALKYPVTVGTEWIAYYMQGTPWTTKKYLSFNIEYVGNMPVSTVKTDVRFQQFPELTGYDYYSKYGLIKRDYLLKDMIVTDSLANPIGLVDMRDKVEIISYNIITP